VQSAAPMAQIPARPQTVPALWMRQKTSTVMSSAAAGVAHDAQHPAVNTSLVVRKSVSKASAIAQAELLQQIEFLAHARCSIQCPSACLSIYTYVREPTKVTRHRTRREDSITATGRPQAAIARYRNKTISWLPSTLDRQFARALKLGLRRGCVFPEAQRSWAQWYRSIRTAREVENEKLSVATALPVWVARSFPF